MSCAAVAADATSFSHATTAGETTSSEAMARREAIGLGPYVCRQRTSGNFDGVDFSESTLDETVNSERMQKNAKSRGLDEVNCRVLVLVASHSLAVRSGWHRHVLVACARGG